MLFLVLFLCYILVVLFQGIGGGIIGVLYSSLPADIYGDLELPTIMGQTSAVASVGIAIFPAVGGFLGEIAWHMPFSISILALYVVRIALRLSLVGHNKSVQWRLYFQSVLSSSTHRQAILLIF